jgi:hypothetical protein
MRKLSTDRSDHRQIALAFRHDFESIRRFADRDHAYVAAWHRYDVGGHDAGNQAPEQLGSRSSVSSHCSDELDSVRPSIGWVAFARHRAAGAWGTDRGAGTALAGGRPKGRGSSRPSASKGGTSVAARAKSSLGRLQGPKQIGSGQENLMHEALATEILCCRTLRPVRSDRTRTRRSRARARRFVGCVRRGVRPLRRALHQSCSRNACPPTRRA